MTTKEDVERNAKPADTSEDIEDAQVVGEEQPEQDRELTDAEKRAQQFNLEHRYFIVKVPDAYYSLPQSDMDTLDRIGKKVSAYREEAGKGELSGIFVEKDWPEFNVVYSMIEHRVNTGESVSLDSIFASAKAKVEADLEIDNSDDAPRPSTLLDALEALLPISYEYRRHADSLDGNVKDRYEAVIKEVETMLESYKKDDEANSP